MSTHAEYERLELLQGTLDLLILRTLIFGSEHGQGIARAIQQTSDHELLVEPASTSSPLRDADTSSKKRASGNVWQKPSR